ncbi:MAG: acetyl-CoA carboxylase biotin carboxylase subunit [Sandaracinaceae bacterium]|nr:acetyl-CoA carboxylase biotin carboxylase subunit [Sandaracinaceae bacterium]
MSVSTPRVPRLLVFQRGEIAVRACLAARALRVPSVLFVTPADVDSLACDHADELYLHDRAEARESFQSLDALRAAIARTGATHVYPGYGFLSESETLAAAVIDAGATFVGPDPGTLGRLADKGRAREFADEAGLPHLGVSLATVPGPGAYPLMLKAAAGGGGRGNLRVDQPGDLPAARERLAARAQQLFGDAALIAERYVTCARHVEVQFFGFGEAGCAVLGTRDCSLQRRHQKVLEEGPASARARELLVPLLPGFTAALARMGYCGAGTLELLHDLDADALYFMEVNPRIQVEHPVTECLVGIDLVRLQLELALGAPPAALRARIVDAERDTLASRGHAIEARVVAEDPANDYAPETGTLVRFELGQAPFARWDAGYREGARVGAHYDGLLAKLIVWGATRAEALERLAQVLDATHVHGLRTNLPLLRSLASDATVLADVHDTGTLERRPAVIAHADVSPLDAALLREAWRLTEAEGAHAHTAQPAPSNHPSLGQSWKDGHRR